MSFEKLGGQNPQLLNQMEPLGITGRGYVLDTVQSQCIKCYHETCI